MLIVLYDDTGLAAWSPFGGRINMPTLQRLADNGLMYSQWHTTALCSPTRSTLRSHRRGGGGRAGSKAEDSVMRAVPVTTEAIRGKRWRYALGGVVLVILGILAIAAPAATSEAIERIIGWLLLIGGVFMAASTWFSQREGWSTWLAFGGSGAAAVGGALLLWSPYGGQDMLTSTLVGFFVASGAAKVAIAMMQRASIPSLWPWLLASGAIDLGMAIAVFTRWPFQSGWFLGLVMGLSLLTSGVLVVLIALTEGPGARSAAPR